MPLPLAQGVAVLGLGFRVKEFRVQYSGLGFKGLGVWFRGKDGGIENGPGLDPQLERH